MYLRTLDIQGFKCFGEPFAIELHDGLNVLVGENGAGKTGVISAIRQLFNDSESGKRVISERDFYRGFGRDDVAAEEINIQATFSDLDRDDVIAFDTWCGNHAEAKLTFTALNQESRGRFKHHTYAGHEYTKAFETEKLDYVHCVYLPPLRDAEIKLREGRQSRLARLLKALCRKDIDTARKARVLHPLEQHVGDFNRELSESDKFAIKAANQRIGESLKAALGAHLSQGTMIQFSEVSFSRIVEGLRLLYFPDLSKADAAQFRALEENSLGYNNLLYIASILAELTYEADEGQGEKTYLRLLLIEEPEAHLHPQLQLRLLRHLKKAAEARGMQVIITTHSTVITAAVSVDHVIHLSNLSRPKAVPLKNCGLPKQSQQFVDRWLDATKSNLLFAKGTILVEGIAEAMVLPALAKIVLQPFGEGRNSLDDYGVSVINLGGIYFNHFMQLFCNVKAEHHGENIPVRCSGLTDNDPPKSVAEDDGEGGLKTIPFLPHAENCIVGNNPALGLRTHISLSEFARLFAGKYKTFEYDIAMEDNNLKTMLIVAAGLWEAQNGTVVKGLKADAKLDFATMTSAQRAPYAGALLDRIDSDDIGKGIYAQAFAEMLEANGAGFTVPMYIRQAILWACGLEEGVG